MAEPKVLVVEDEADVRRHVVRALKRERMDVAEAEDGEQGRERFDRNLYPVVLLDLRMPKLDGLALLEHIRHRQPETQVIILTGHGDKRDAIRALNLRAAAFIEKPPDIDQIIAAIRTAWDEYCDRIGVYEAPDDEPPPDLEEVRQVLASVPITDDESSPEQDPGARISSIPMRSSTTTGEWRRAGESMC